MNHLQHEWRRVGGAAAPAGGMSPRRARRLALAAGGLALAGLSVAAQPPGLTRHATNGTYGCRRAFGFGVYNPAADRTAICWNGEGMSIYAREYDHRARVWSDVTLIQALNHTTKWDYHNYPCIVLAPDGRYLIFNCKHGGAAYMMRAPLAGTIAGQWERRQIANDRCAYPMPVVVGDTVHLFYSSNAGDRYRTYRMIASRDNGQTWSHPTTLIDSGNLEPEHYNTVYVHGFSVVPGKAGGRAARILIGWEMASGPLGHNQGGHGNYFAWYDCGTRRMYSAAGEDLGPTVDWEAMAGKCRINDAKSPTTRLFNYTTLPEMLPDGSVAVAYALEGKSVIARWANGRWVSTAADFGGRPLDYQRTWEGRYRILAGRQGGLGVWESADGVTGWREVSHTPIPHENGSTGAAAAFIDDFRPEVQWMACCYSGKTYLSDYSGRWPVFTYGTAAATSP